MLPFMFYMKGLQDLLDDLPCVCRVLVRSEAIAKLPRTVVKRRTSPVKLFDTAIAQNHEVPLLRCGPPRVRRAWGLGGVYCHD